MKRRKRRLIVLAGLGLAAALAAGGWRGLGIVEVGVAYKAKAVCSGVFVSERGPADVLLDLHIDDLAALEHVRVTMDTLRGSVTASAVGLIRRTAVYDEGFGCTLVFDDRLPPRIPLPGSAAGSSGPDLPRSAEPSPAVQAVIERAFGEPALRQRRTRAVVVIQDGRIVGEQYAAGMGPRTPLIGWSMTKSVMNALAGVVVGRGDLTLDAPVPIDEWREPRDARASITLDHLLRMSSGLRFDEGMESPRADVTRMLFDAGDASALAIRQPLVAEPGTLWHYSSGTSNIIARAIRNALRDDADYLTLPRRALFDRIGMAGAVLETDATGTFLGSSNLYATAHDWSRFGLLYLNDGMHGDERILPEGWVEYSVTPAPADSTGRYGAHFWLEVPEEYCTTGDDLPDDAFHAAGHEAQFVTIVPSRDLVIVRLGRTRYPEAWDHCAFARDVLAALDTPVDSRD